MKLTKIKNNLRKNKTGAIPILAWLAIAVIGTGLAYVAVENITEKPTYDIGTQTTVIEQAPFSFFGFEMSLELTIIALIILLFGIAILFRPRTQQ